MAIRKFIKGTGMTAEPWFTADGEDLEPGMHAFFDRWNSAQREGDGDFAAVSLHAVKVSQAILAAAGPGPHEADSEADFAERILWEYGMAAKLIREGDADGAARFACKFGKLVAMAALKFNYEESWRRGEKTKAAAQEGARTINSRKAAKVAARQEEIRRTVKDIKRRHPAHSTSRVNELAAETLHLSKSTVERALRPGKK